MPDKPTPSRSTAVRLSLLGENLRHLADELCERASENEVRTSILRLAYTEILIHRLEIIQPPAAAAPILMDRIERALWGKSLENEDPDR